MIETAAAFLKNYLDGLKTMSMFLNDLGIASDVLILIGTAAFVYIVFKIIMWWIL